MHWHIETRGRWTASLIVNFVGRTEYGGMGKFIIISSSQSLTLNPQLNGYLYTVGKWRSSPAGVATSLTTTLAILLLYVKNGCSISEVLK